MVSDGLSFCTNCGAQNPSVNEFCTGCGARLDSGSVSQVKEATTVFAGATKRGNPLKELLKSAGLVSRKNLIILVAAVLGSFVVGAGLASENVFYGIVGNRYTEKRLENEKQQSYTIGYKSGEDVGYQRGNSDGYASGYSTGVSDGCNKVFDRVGADQLIAIFYPYRSLNLGRYYSTRSDTC
jgi:hypothetical protein